MWSSDESRYDATSSGETTKRTRGNSGWTAPGSAQVCSATPSETASQSS